MTPKPIVTTMLFLLAIALSGAASAQNEADAEKAYQVGKQAMKDGDYDVACPAFERSQLLDPRPGTLLTLALCRDQAERIATAVQLYEEFLREIEKIPAALRARYKSRAAKALARLNELLPQVPKLTLTLPADAPEEVAIQRNGVRITIASLNVPLPVDPGEQVIRTQVGDGPVVEHRITLRRGEATVVTLEVKLPEPAPATAPGPLSAEPPRIEPPPPAPVTDAKPDAKPAERPEAKARSAAAAPPPPRAAPGVDPRPPPPGAPGMSGQRVGALFAGGAGLAGIALGIATGVTVLEKKSIIQSHCTGATCDAEGKAAADSASIPAAVSTVGFCLGGAGIATGLLLWLTDAWQPEVGTAMRRMHATVSADATNIVVGVKGVW